jgi:hypothetical protein
VAKIGDNGKQFPVNEKFAGTADGEGKLFLRISGSPWGVCSGNFTIKVTSEAAGVP